MGRLFGREGKGLIRLGVGLCSVGLEVGREALLFWKKGAKNFCVLNITALCAL